MVDFTCNITSQQMVIALKAAGLKKKDCVFVHSALSKFGYVPEAKDKIALANLVIKCFTKVIGPTGTLAAPTYTYSFTKNEVYDPLNTQSLLGTFPEVLRQQPYSIRSNHPLFSVAAIGPMAKFLTQDLDHSSFGKNSSLGRLLDINATIVFFGADLESGVFVHYIEEEFRVPYRFDKKFKGMRIIDGKRTEDSYSFYVRYLDRNVETYLTPFQKYLVKNHLMTEVKLGQGYIRTIKAKTFYDEGMKALNKNIYYFLKEKPDL